MTLTKHTWTLDLVNIKLEIMYNQLITFPKYYVAGAVVLFKYMPPLYYVR
jgi:hypothetical protein